MTHNPNTATDSSNPFTILPLSPDRQRLILTGNLTVHRAAALHRLAIGLAARPTSVEIDCSGVHNLDTTSLQILLSLYRDVVEQGGACVWRGVQGPTRDIFRQTGLTKLLPAEPTAEGHGAAPVHPR
jgi:anti-anti-sigma factor